VIVGIATTWALMLAPAGTWLTAAVMPTASRAEWTCRVIQAATNSYGRASWSVLVLGEDQGDSLLLPDHDDGNDAGR